MKELQIVSHSVSALFSLPFFREEQDTLAYLIPLVSTAFLPAPFLLSLGNTAV